MSCLVHAQAPSEENSFSSSARWVRARWRHPPHQDDKTDKFEQTTHASNLPRLVVVLRGGVRALTIQWCGDAKGRRRKRKEACGDCHVATWSARTVKQEPSAQPEPARTLPQGAKTKLKPHANHPTHLNRGIWTTLQRSRGSIPTKRPYSHYLALVSCRYKARRLGALSVAQLVELLRHALARGDQKSLPVCPCRASYFRNMSSQLPKHANPCDPCPHGESYLEAAAPPESQSLHADVGKRAAGNHRLLNCPAGSKEDRHACSAPMTEDSATRRQGPAVHGACLVGFGIRMRGRIFRNGGNTGQV